MPHDASPRWRRPWLHVLVGLSCGLGYAQLNTQTDEWARLGEIGRAFAAFHAFVDRGIPLLAGALVGLAVHWLQLRSRLARAEASRVEELRSRLGHVERDQAVWVVAASTLHELKNPLHTMGLLVDELQDLVVAGDSAALLEHVEHVRLQMERTASPLQALRSLTRNDPRERSLRPVGPALEDIVEALRPIAADSGVELRLENTKEASAAIDVESLRIIVDNLVVNALEGVEGRRHASVVAVRLEQSAGSLRLRVSDDGAGVDVEHRASVFEPLRSEKSSGLGLGLPIARALARSLGGELAWIEVPPYTTTFELVLPREAPAR